MNWCAHDPCRVWAWTPDKGFHCWFECVTCGQRLKGVHRG